LIGFEYSAIEASSKCIPKEIIVQGGAKPDKMHVIGKMEVVPDDFYINFSVRVLGFNFGSIREKVGLISCMNKNPEIKYIRLTIKAPELTCISDALGTSLPTSKNNSSGINFLSIQGYNCIPNVAYSSSLVKSLEILSKPQHNQLI